MDHNEAKTKMASEKYLLGELTPQEVDAFEEHMFGCPECAMDVRAADAFMREAGEQLAHFPVTLPTPVAAKPEQPKPKRFRWFFQMGRSFAIPAFASLLGVIAYQNFSVIPNLRLEATAPRIAPSFATLHIGARGAEATVVPADRTQGAVILVQLPQSGGYSSFAFDLYDAGGKQLWSRSAAAPGSVSDGTLSLAISPIGLQSGSYTLAISGVASTGARTEIDRRALDVHFEP